MSVHSTAIVEAGAELHPSCEIGPYACIGPHVSLGPGVQVGPHAVVQGHTRIGEGTHVFQLASVGAPPQDLKYAGEPTRLEVGAHNQIREFATLHTGTLGGGGVTRVGDRNLFMAYSHVAHDCQIGSGCVLANGATLAGHVRVDDSVILGGLSAVHQFARIGKYAFVSGGAMVTLDIPPYCTVQGDRAKLTGLNTVGLTRAGFTEAQIKRIKGAYRTVFRAKLGLREALARVHAEYPDAPEVDAFVRFIEGSERGVAR